MVLSDSAVATCNKSIIHCIISDYLRILSFASAHYRNPCHTTGFDFLQCKNHSRETQNASRNGVGHGHARTSTVVRRCTRLLSTISARSSALIAVAIAILLTLVIACAGHRRRLDHSTFGVQAGVSDVARYWCRLRDQPRRTSRNTSSEITRNIRLGSSDFRNGSSRTRSRARTASCISGREDKLRPTNAWRSTDGAVVLFNV